MRSLRWRLVGSYALLTLITVGIMLGLSATLLRQYVNQQEQAALQANADAIAKQAVHYMSPRPKTFELEQVARASAFLGNVRVQILNAQNELVIDTGLRPPRNYEITIDGRKYRLVRREDSYWGVRFIFEEVTGQQDSEVKLDESDLSALTQTTQAEMRYTGKPLMGYVRVSNLRRTGSDNLLQTLQTLGIAGGAAIALAVLMGLLISKGLLSPLRKLAQATTRLATGDFAARAELPNRKDEIGTLAHQFDQMATQLQKSFADLQAERDALRNFIADTSHELRTPITALKMYNELLQGKAAQDAPAREEFLQESQRQLTRLEWMTQNLLDLSRLDAGLVKLNLSEVDVGEMAVNVASDLKAMAVEKEIELVVRKPSTPLLAQLDHTRMEIALCNLVENAIKFTPVKGQVDIAIAKTDLTLELSVSDTGIGIPPEDLPHIFDRFYRAQNTAGIQGSGLGLAIAHSIAKAHGGTVRVSSVPHASGTAGGGSTFVIVLPLSH